MSVSFRAGITTAKGTHPPDLRRRTRLLAAVLLPIGPAAVAMLRFTLPYATTDGPEEMVTAVHAAPGRQSAVLWLGLAAILTLVPAAIWVGRLTRAYSFSATSSALCCSGSRCGRPTRYRGGRRF